jgi:hypothetical protein
VRVTIDEAADIYARACVAWYGSRALPIVWQQVQVMQKRGDKSGVEAWTKVALALERMQRPPIPSLLRRNRLQARICRASH